MLTDFRKAPAVISDLFIDGVKVERVTEYRYLGTVLDKKLHFNRNTDFIHKRCQPRIWTKGSLCGYLGKINRCSPLCTGVYTEAVHTHTHTHTHCFTHFLPELY